ncbi:hypothetical protein CEUSTIGMA_g2426.t1 [Chlamydomonas eustigma]|uniref:Uncharacterized protein n=1 Tax=Chlamydomonas eustigma TaxID=1157962 RepID=A0A250WWT4_9CHLO|nr:hypothetical protein CEUSTIGMA_g2426.t1 [Chlamydomonas eustigma]|eukprot:GAX74980.1 hypothetical protein CEUSTIGMA_g2426.t1 [Chlamydomonas eustigma]
MTGRQEQDLFTFSRSNCATEIERISTLSSPLFPYFEETSSGSSVGRAVMRSDTLAPLRKRGFSGPLPHITIPITTSPRDPFDIRCPSSAIIRPSNPAKHSSVSCHLPIRQPGLLDPLNNLGTTFKEYVSHNSDPLQTPQFQTCVSNNSERLNRIIEDLPKPVGRLKLPSLTQMAIPEANRQRPATADQEKSAELMEKDWMKMLCVLTPICDDDEWLRDANKASGCAIFF